MNITCDREEDVLDAVMSGRWRAGGPWDGALREHVAGCPVCGDLAAVADVLRDECDEAWREACLPTSGQVWWRATMRTRAEAAATAGRPITLLQRLAGACAAGLSAGLVRVAWPSVQQPLASMGGLLSREAERIGGQAVWGAAAQEPVLFLGIILGAGLILPLVLYFALSDD